ncbi:MAG: hypothetical protein ACI8ZM_001633 [Crocinitomix sp.]|jgi:hypothetical protein
MEDINWQEGIVLAEGRDVTFIHKNGSLSYKATFNEKKDIYTLMFPDQEQ